MESNGQVEVERDMEGGIGPCGLQKVCQSCCHERTEQSMAFKMAGYVICHTDTMRQMTRKDVTSSHLKFLDCC